MFGQLFDSPWKILIVALVIIVLFGSKKLPYAARSLGQSMRILKKEVQSLHEDDEPVSDAPSASSASSASGASPAFPPPAAIAASQQPDQQQAQIDALQQQIRDLQRAATMDTTASAPVQAGAAAEPQRTQPS
jgi:sec-independent protein translocase protein TatA